jgi:hypothetical protein
MLTLVEFQGLTTAAQGRRMLLTENFESNNSFLWRQLTASESSPNTLFLSPKCPPAWASAVTARLDYFRSVILEELKKSLLPEVFQQIADVSVSSRRKLHRAQPLVQQLVFSEKRVTQSLAFR